MWSFMCLPARLFSVKFSQINGATVSNYQFNGVNRYIGTNHRCSCPFNRAESDTAAGATAIVVASQNKVHNSGGDNSSVVARETEMKMHTARIRC